MKKINLLPLILLLLASCSSLPDWLGSEDDKGKLPGERFAVMEDTTKIAADPTLSSESVDIPEAVNTSSAGLNYGNFYVQGEMSSVQSASAGDEPEDDFFLAYSPAVEGGAVYVIDGHSNISAYDAENLNQKWEKKSSASKKDKDLPGGGVTVAMEFYMQLLVMVM